VEAEELFWIIALSYLATAVGSKFFFDLGTPQAAPLIYAVLFLALLYLGKRLRDATPERIRAGLYTFLFLLVLGLTGVLPLILGLGAFMIIALFLHCGTLKRHLYYVGLGLLVLLPATAILLGGIPLVNESVRYSSWRLLYLATGYIAVVMLSERPDWKVLLWGIIIGVLSTFRTVVLAVILAYLFGNFSRGKHTDWKALGIVTLGIVAGLTARYHATLLSYNTWHLGPIESLLYRPGVTYTVYEKLYALGMPFGHHRILISPQPKLFVGSLFGRDVGYTYTIFGQPVYDFGVLGLLEALLIGMAVGDAERHKSTGAMALTLLTLALPIGIDAFFFSSFMALGILGMGVKLWRRKLCP
jgi:uncharacterized membrane protein